MGLFEFLRKAIRDITGKDPEKQDSSALYRFYDTTTGNPWVTAGTASPFKYYAASPTQLPPGWLYSDAMEMCPEGIWVSGIGALMKPVYVNANSTGTIDLATAQWRQNYAEPFHSTGAAVTPSTSTGTTDEWKPFFVTGSLVGGTLDLTVKAAVAGEDVEAVLLACGAINIADSATVVQNKLDWEDDDASAPAAGSSYCYTYLNDLTNSRNLGSPTQNLSQHACWGLGNTGAGLQIEWTEAGGAGNIDVFIAGIYRVH